MLNPLPGQRLKFVIDRFMAFVGLIVTSPIFLIVAIILKAKGEDVFFIQERVGQFEQPFKMFKFTTMPKGSEKKGLITTANDLRVIPFGRFLRRSKLNEIPQLINILKGDMSFVGPRPLVKAHAEIYPPNKREKIYSVKPGLTGYGSIEFSEEDKLTEKADDLEKYYAEVIMPKKAELEIWYIDHFSIILDFSIIFRTIFKLLMVFLKRK